MSENKENQPSMQNVVTSIVPSQRPKESMEERQRKKQAFNKLLNQADLNNRLRKVAKRQRYVFENFKNQLIDQMCDGTLTMQGVIVVSYGILNFGSVFLYENYNFSGMLHNAIRATHSKEILIDTRIVKPKDEELYQKQQSSLLVVFTNQGAIFFAEKDAKPSEWDLEAVQGAVTTCEVEMALNCNTMYAVARYCEKEGSRAMLDIAEDCYRWMLTRKGIDRRSFVYLAYQAQQYEAFLDLCNDRFMSWLRNDEDKKQFGKWREEALKQLASPQLTNQAAIEDGHQQVQSLMNAEQPMEATA